MGAALALGEDVRDSFAAGREKFEEVVAYLKTKEVRGMKHSELERELEKRGREIMRELYQGYLDSRSPGEAQGEVRDAEGVARNEKRTHKRDLETVFGTVGVERKGYGRENARSLHPLDGELNLPKERYSHEVRRRVAEEAAKGSFDETVESVGQHSGAHVPKRQAEELVVRAAQDFDDFYAAREAKASSDGSGADEAGSILVLSTDGKGVVMRREDLRPATRQAAESRRHKLAGRLSKGEKRNSKRMATVASVYTVAPHVRTAEQVASMLAPVHEEAEQERPRPEKKRVWASIEKSPEEVIEEAFREGLARDPNKKKVWVALVDGNKHQLRVLKKHARRYAVTLIVVLDVIHVLEYLWKAGLAMHAEGSKELQAWVYERFLSILRGGASNVAAGMRRSATLRQLDRQSRGAIDSCANYLLKYRKYLSYNEYLAQGLPIATGVIEGACRHLVKDRMDLTGARWSLQGAEAVLRLRALRSSHDFDEYWTFHEECERRRNHASNYAGGEVPATFSRRHQGRCHLKVVK
jgi:hypothetical protein